MDSTIFVRKSFYVQPPTKDSAPAEWEAWLKKDTQAAINAKRAFTKSLPACEIPANAQGTTARKVNGVWKASTSIGFVGDAETGHLEPVVEATQEKECLLASLTQKARGISHIKTGSEKRKARKLRRQARKMGM